MSRTVISAHGVNDDNSVHYVTHTFYHHSHNNILQGKNRKTEQVRTSQYVSLAKVHLKKLAQLILEERIKLN